MKISIAQLDPIIGDIVGNVQKIKETLKTVKEKKSDLVIFSEMFITGYPPRDLLQKKKFIQDIQWANNEVTKISKKFSKIGILFGTVLPTNNSRGNGLYNSALLVQNGKVIGRVYKTLLPTYDVFDETRYFDSSPKVDIIPFKNEILGISICEDMWNVSNLSLKKYYKIDPISVLAKKGATILINLSASPFNIGKEKIRYEIITCHSKKYHLPFVYVNQVGGNDELIFDGKSMVVDKNGNLIDILPGFREKIKTINLNKKLKIKKFIAQEDIASVYEALVLGVRDYFKKCGFKKAVIGLSGGIDSAVTSCLAVAALGRRNVLAITMPSMYSSKGSVEFSKKLARNLGIEIKKVPIEKIYYSYLNELKKYFQNRPFDVTEENIQARIRGNILMAFSNKFGYLVLSTGNKSELAVGYCTLYGDMSGGLSVISDVPKTMVYKLADYINRKKEIIPKEVIKAAPSAELKPGQRDQDTLPPYNILDQILELYLDKNYSSKEIIRKGFNQKIVNWIIHRVNKSEYKRRQAAPGLKVTTKAFGSGRRMPIAAKYKT
ncbi:NAD+ synthase [bacterium]|nr:NAD+ synthase [bacterium]